MKESSPFVSSRLAAGFLALAAAFALVLGTSGCSQNGPPATYSVDSPPPFLTADVDGVLGVSGGNSGSSSDSWVEIARQTVRPDRDDQEVSGGRYTLIFPSGAVSEDTEILIKERDPAVLEIELDPHGIQFGAPVTLQIDLSGTNADPKSKNYDGSVPEFYWLNEDTGLWEIIPGSLDPVAMTYTVLLSHFSRYGVGGDGTAGWE